MTTEVFGEEELSRAPKVFWTPGSLVLSLCKLGSCAAHPAALICAANVVIKIIEQKKILAGLVLVGSSSQNTVISNFSRKYKLFKIIEFYFSVRHCLHIPDYFS